MMTDTMKEQGVVKLKWKSASRWRWWAAAATLLSGCSLNFSPPSVTETISGAPEVSIVAPLANSTYMEGVNVIVQALVTNAGSDIDRVEVSVDAGIIATLADANPDGAVSFSITQSWPASGAGTHTVGVTAFRSDGLSSAPTSVTFAVIPTAAENTPEVQPPSTNQTSSTQPPANTQAPATPAPTNPTQAQPPTAVPPTQSTTPVATFNQPVNVRRGPGTAFNPPIGSFNAGQTADILARNTGGDWYKVRYGTGEGWVFAALVSVAGDVSALPVDPGPPVPTAAPPTAVPPTPIPAVTATAATTANLVAGVVVLTPSEPVCNETFSIGFDVANLGSEATAASSTVSVQDVRASDGSLQQQTIGGFPVLQPGQTFRADMPLTVSTWFDEDHRLILIIDPNSQVPETQDGDNRVELTYRLSKGSC
jgi:uncharacterized protein YraI